MRKPSVLVVFLTVFIDLVGFGIVVPLIPLFGGKYVTPLFGEGTWASGFAIGAVIASYSAMQFIFSPIWGRLSDRIGRRPVLLMSTAGAAGSYVIFALSAGMTSAAAALTMMIAARAFAGVCGGNITVAQAYIADITPPENRSKRMGLVGMAFGLGFIFGPAIGGISLKYLGNTGPGWIAAGLCAANFILTFAILPESRKPDSVQAPKRPRFSQWSHTLSQPNIGLLVTVFFLATFCFSCFESTLALLVSGNFHLQFSGTEMSAGTVTYLFTYCGLISALVQGGLIGRLVKKMGEPKLIGMSLVLTAVSLAVLPFIKGTTPLSWHILFQHDGLPWLLLLLALAVLAVGSSLTRPPLFGLLSNLTSSSEQGATIGVAQSAGSLARILGPIFATTLFVRWPAVPFIVCTAVLLVTSFYVSQKLRSVAPVGATPATPPV